MSERVHVSNIKVLMYHRVLEKSPPEDTTWHYVLADEFRKQLRMIDKLGYTPITFYDYYLYLEDKLTLPKNPIIITFDDGYLDTYDIALPILLEFDMSAVIFALGNRNLKRAEWEERDHNDKCPLMTNEQLQIAASLGFEIGAHSMNHLDLTKIKEAKLFTEIVKSKKEIEKLLAKPVYTFAYPYGKINKQIRSMAAEAGYSFACGVYTGPYRFGNDLYDIRRLAINNNTGTVQYLLRLLTPYQYIEWLYAKILGPDKEVVPKTAKTKKPVRNLEKSLHS